MKKTFGFIIILLLMASLTLNGCGVIRHTDEESANSNIQKSVVTVEDDAIPSDIVKNELIQEEYEFGKVLLDNVHSGGVPKDGIPSIDKPDYLAVNQAVELFKSDEPVFLVELEKEVYLHPQSVMVWHEIVNLPDQDLALTYCPLTGSAITYEYPEGTDTSFGTSGKLINSNLLMYERENGKLISQIDGIILNGDQEGLVLETVPTYWITWEKAVEFYPEAKVLTRNTGFLRDYESDPYGSYTDDVRANYYKNDGVMFPLIEEDEEGLLDDKKVVIGVKSGDARLAIDPLIVKDKGNYSFELNGSGFIAVYDESLDIVRVFEKHKDIEAEDYLDNPSEYAQPIHFEIMWFAWYAFYPDTEVILNE